MSFLLMCLSSDAYDISMRLAEPQDMAWVNHSYESIQFVRSNLENEIIAIAEVNGNKVGVGRLVLLQDRVYELGGMYVRNEYRNRGIATKIIEFLLHKIDVNCTIYCLPFAHLVSLYQKFGLRECGDLSHVPKKLSDKLLWCQQTYEHDVRLLIREKK